MTFSAESNSNLSNFHEIIGPLAVEVATERDLVELTELINGAYRGEKARRLSWSTEADLLDGQRTDEQMLADQMRRHKSFILKAKSDAAAEIVGCVGVEKMAEEICYLGNLTVHVERQGKGYGDALLKAGELFARKLFACKTMRMTVLLQRPELIKWYERRGYESTNEERPFPYGDERFGKPLRDDLKFIILKKSLV